MAEIKLDPRPTQAAGLCNLFVSLNGGISWLFVGHLHEGRGFVGQPNFLKLSSDDREAVLAAIDEEYEVPATVVKPIPPGLDWSSEDSEPQP